MCIYTLDDDAGTESLLDGDFCAETTEIESDNINLDTK